MPRLRWYLIGLVLLAAVAGCTAAPTPTAIPTRLVLVATRSATPVPDMATMAPSRAATPSMTPTFAPATAALTPNPWPSPTLVPSTTVRPTEITLPTATPTARLLTATPVPPTSVPATPAPTPPEQVDPLVSSLVVTPDDPPVLFAVIEQQLYRSVDRGASWIPESRAGLADEARFNAIAIDYRHPQTMYALTDRGIYRQERGADWTLVNTLRATALAVDFEDSSTLWAGIYRTTETNAVIVKSTDTGKTWGKADLGIPYAGWASDILIDPENPNTLWAVVRSSGRHNWPPGDLYRGGREGRWEKLDLGPFTPAYTNTKSCHVSGIAYDPNVGLLFAGCDLSYFNAGATHVLRSRNPGDPNAGAVAWEVATEFRETLPALGTTRPLAVDARPPKTLFLAVAITTYGPDQAPHPSYRILVSHDDGASWQPLGLQGLPSPSES